MQGAPALNVEAASVGGLTSFLTRARRRVAPSVLALGSVEDHLLIFLGTVDARPEDFVSDAGRRGLAALTEATRMVCGRLIVA